MKQLLQIQVDDLGNIFFHTDYDFPEVAKRRPPMDWEDGLYRELSYSILHAGTLIRRAVKFISVASNDPRADYLGLHPGLEEALVQWRKEKAEQQKVPSYHILHQRVLLAIADNAPLSEMDLLDIPGFGPHLLERYGKEILDLVQRKLGEEDQDYVF